MTLFIYLFNKKFKNFNNFIFDLYKSYTFRYVYYI